MDPLPSMCACVLAHNIQSVVCVKPQREKNSLKWLLGICYVMY